MAGRTKKKKTAPHYSADTLALRIVLGLILIGLGVCIFLAVDMGIANGVSFFSGLRRVTLGAFGTLSFILPFLFIWAGTLTVISSQRSAAFRSLWWACLAFFCLTTVINLGSHYGMMEFFRAISEGSAVDRNYATSDWRQIVGGTYELCTRYGAAGGACGALLGWPLYRLMGPVLGCLLTGVGTLASAMMAAGLSPTKIRKKLAERQKAPVDPEQERHQREMLRQQQEREEQRRYEERRRREERARREREAYEAQAQAGYQWERQQSMRRAAENAPSDRTGSIFGNRDMPRVAEGERRVFWPFGRKNDGLCDPPVEQNTGREQRNTTEKPERPRNHVSYIFGDVSGNGTVTDPQTDNAQNIENSGNVPVTDPAPEETESGFMRPAYVGPAEESAASEGTQPEQEQDTWKKVSPKYRRKPEIASNLTEREKKDPEKEPWQETEKEPEREPENGPEKEPEKVTEIPATEPQSPVRRTAKKPEQIHVPEVQQTLGRESWKPELKLPPKPEGEEEQTEDDVWTPTPYNFPPITDLKVPSAPTQNNVEEDVSRSRTLEKTLEAFKVKARVVNVTHGPAISRFELELATGTKVNKVTELEKDIAYGMEAVSVRIEAPIPGKSLVGVEVPNPTRDTVTLREVLESAPMQNAKSVLTVALGKDIAGTPVVCDLERMPHLLIAGATGSGKSVCINTIINSLLYRTTPDEVKMILIDPKVVELKCYNGIPHLLIPVVNEPRKAATALAWAVGEMMERYDQFSRFNVRNIEGYNNQLGPGEKPMPRIVVIIDELADLMMTCKKDVEDYICRLTQLARAAGIHLIVATQRPSVDVITGLIKANIPSRIAFKTASYTDSRTILDRNGSEQLLGWGDMLYLPVGSFVPLRVQGCFVSDGEVQKITDDVRRANPCTYDPDVLDRLEELSQEKETATQTMDTVGGANEALDVDQSLFEQCVEMAIQDGQISTSTLQRRLRIGYSRAGRLTDQLEERGIVSAKDGSKPRKCLITREEWEEIKKMTDGDMQ